MQLTKSSAAFLPGLSSAHSGPGDQWSKAEREMSGVMGVFDDSVDLVGCPKDDAPARTKENGPSKPCYPLSRAVSVRRGFAPAVLFFWGGSGWLGGCCFGEERPQRWVVLPSGLNWLISFGKGNKTIQHEMKLNPRWCRKNERNKPTNPPKVVSTCISWWTLHDLMVV